MKYTPFFIITVAFAGALMFFGDQLRRQLHAHELAFSTHCHEKLNGITVKTERELLCLRTDAILLAKRVGQRLD